jgi:hypothetical protein
MNEISESVRHRARRMRSRCKTRYKTPLLQAGNATGVAAAGACRGAGHAVADRNGTTFADSPATTASRWSAHRPQR